MTGSAQPLTPSTQRKRSRNTPKPRWPPGSARRSAGGVWPPLLACLALVVALLGGGGWLWFTPTASVSVDINPSLELRLNRFSRVVAVEGANADGQAPDPGAGPALPRLCGRPGGHPGQRHGLRPAGPGQRPHHRRQRPRRGPVPGPAHPGPALYRRPGKRPLLLRQQPGA